MKNSPELREAYEQTPPLLFGIQHLGCTSAANVRYATATSQRPRLRSAAHLNRKSGIGLLKEKQQRYGEIATSV